MHIMKKLVGAIIHWLMRTNEAKEHGLSDFEKVRFELKACDVLLIDGRGHADKVIQSISQSRWSHAALYIGRLLDIADQDLKTIIQHFYTGPKDTPLIVESRLGDGICVRPLQQYEHEHIRICRPKSLSKKEANQVIRFAINRLGSYKSGANIFDLVRFFVPLGMLSPSWRRRAFLHWAGRNTKNVTAAFVAECFGFIQFPVYPLVKTSSEQGVQLLRRHPKLCLPYEIDLSPNFEIIKYPFIDFQIHEDERLIPWKGSGIFSGVDQNSALAYKPSVKPLVRRNNVEEGNFGSSGGKE